MSLSISLGRTISLESAWEALAIVSASSCPTGVPMVALIETGRLSLRCGQMRIKSIELLHFAVCAPAVVTVPRVAEMGVSSRFKTTRQIVLRRQFVGNGLVVHKAVGVC
jgi:hypothetical protein